MTEVTKRCPRCGGSSDAAVCSPPHCPTCSGTGRVPFDAAKEWTRFTAEQQDALLERAWLIWEEDESADEARQACDAELLRLGYVLDDGEDP